MTKAMKTYLDSENSEVRIEILPLIDVIFCVLTFFILAAVGLTRPEGINLDLPEAKTSNTQLGEILQVRIDGLGQLYVDQQPVTQGQLTQTLQTYVRAKPTGIIVLSADRLVSYDQVIQVLDLLQSVGGNRVALGTTTPDNAAQEQPGTSPQTPDILPLPPLSDPNVPTLAPPNQQPPIPSEQIPAAPGQVPNNPEDGASGASPMPTPSQ